MDPDWNPRPLDVLLGFVPGMPMPGGHTWHPTDVERKSQSTEDAHWRSRWALIHGRKWAALTRRYKRCESSREAHKRGILRVRRWIENGDINMADVPEKDMERAELALSYCAGLVEDTLQDHKHRLNAAKTLLDFLKPKPAQKTDVTLRTPESFLDEIAND